MKKLMKKGKSGFTLVELVIVIAILAIVAAIAIPTAANVIGNANKAADNSNAQAIELAIKTCQSEAIANQTNKSDIYSTLQSNYSTDKKLTTLLAAYGIASTALTPKQTNYHFVYTASSGKVIATDASATTGQTVLDANTTFTIKDDVVTIP